MLDWLKLKHKLDALLTAMKHAEEKGVGQYPDVAMDHLPSLRNFIHYLTLRQMDVRSLQLELADLGLSSFGRSEGYVMGSLQAISDRINDALLGYDSARTTGSLPIDQRPHLGNADQDLNVSSLSWKQSEGILHKNTRKLFGPKPENRHVYIMVTAPQAGIANEAWFDQLLDTGMNILRLNAAHESTNGIFQLLNMARKRAQLKKKPLKILVDVPGPKLRTESINPGIPVLKIKPACSVDGRVTKPAWVEIHSSVDTMSPFATVPQLLMTEAQDFALGTTVTFRDLRNKKRSLIVIEQIRSEQPAYRCLLNKTVYFGPLTEVRWNSKPMGNGPAKKLRGTLTHSQCVPWSAKVPVGGLFGLVREGITLEHLPQGLRNLPAMGTCNAIFEALAPNTTVIFDDGKIVAQVCQVFSEGVILRVDQAIKGFARLRAAMGINLPGVNLKLPALSPEDITLIHAVKDHVDLLGISFVRSVADMDAVKEALGLSAVPVMIKVETRSCFQNLPDILLSILGQRNIAVMIARGDLAVECGFERLAEVQEEILWLCEAAHIPVVWATQVLETLAKTGIPTRAEITDAAMSVRAECVMLNKGLYITSAVKSLDSILKRMEAHQYKKRQLYRPLKLSVPAYIRDPKEVGRTATQVQSPQSIEISLH